MSRIKGTYTLYVGEVVVRWLDPLTGSTWDREQDGNRMNTGFHKQVDGTWSSVQYTFIPTEPAADWYVLAYLPEYAIAHNRTHVTGPFTEAEARTTAVKRAGRYPKNTYSVFQVLAGNTVKVVPPTPPKAEIVWS